MFKKISVSRTIVGFIRQYHVFLISFFILAMISPYWLKNLDLNGDEPHYLAITQSLYAHHTFNLKEFYTNEEWHKYIPDWPVLDKHIIANSTNEKIISIHQPGLSIIVLPAYAIGVALNNPKLYVLLFINIISALIIQNIFYFLKEKIKDLYSVYAVTFAILLTFPFIVYSHLMFSDILAALLIIYGFRGKNQILRLLSIACLPWVHLKYLTILLILGVKYIIDEKRYWLGGIVLSLSLLSFSIYSKVYYGAFIPINNVTTAGGFGSFKGIFWLLIERTMGLLNYAPFYILIFAGLSAYYYENRREFIFWLLIILAVFIPNGVFNDWSGGMSPPARYLVCIIPLFSLPIALFLSKAKGKLKYINWGIFIFLLYFSLRVSWKAVRIPVSMYTSRPSLSFYFESLFHYNPYKIFPDGGSANPLIYFPIWGVFIILLILYGYYLQKKYLNKKHDRLKA